MLVPLLIMLSLILLIDMYAFKAVRILTINFSPGIKTILHWSYWAVPAFIFIGMAILYITKTDTSDPGMFKKIYPVSGVMITAYLPKLNLITFQLLHDLKNLIAKVIPNTTIGIWQSPVFIKIGMVLAAVSFLFLLYGVIYGKFQFKVRKVPLTFQNLPNAFNGFKIIQLSDIHIGSFIGNEKQIERLVEKVNKLEPDVILFTGDMVNNVAAELNPFVPILAKLNAKYGKFSVMGNHDYGEYVNWKTKAEKDSNLLQLKQLQTNAGFTMLDNTSTSIKINTDSIHILGVENWGAPPFPQHGDINKALANIPENTFKILMSHDPSHWDAEIKTKTTIDLTLSGHTHGMQMGIRLGKLKWSLVKLKYPKWGGSYIENDQTLFVSTGAGFIGYPGRAGMPPEIVQIELSNK